MYIFWFPDLRTKCTSVVVLCWNPLEFIYVLMNVISLIYQEYLGNIIYKDKSV